MDQLSFIEVSYTLLQPKEQEPRMELCPYVHKLGVKKVTNRGLMPLSRFTRSWPPIRAKKRPTHSKSCVELEPQHQVPLGQTRSIYCKKVWLWSTKADFYFLVKPLLARPSLNGSLYSETTRSLCFTRHQPFLDTVIWTRIVDPSLILHIKQIMQKRNVIQVINTNSWENFIISF